MGENDNLKLLKFTCMQTDSEMISILRVHDTPEGRRLLVDTKYMQKLYCMYVCRLKRKRDTLPGEEYPRCIILPECFCKDFSPCDALTCISAFSSWGPGS